MVRRSHVRGARRGLVVAAIGGSALAVALRRMLSGLPAWPVGPLQVSDGGASNDDKKKKSEGDDKKKKKGSDDKKKKGRSGGSDGSDDKKAKKGK